MTTAHQPGVYLTHEDMNRLEANILWLEGDHERCNPFLARTLRALLAERDRLRETGQAVVDRWDTPLWKEAEATGRVINRLRAALKGDQT